MSSAAELPLVSVIIPTWNRAHTLEAAIRSALLQEGARVEVLVCDDGSTDGSEALVKSLADARVRWLSGPRAGRPAVPRNRGLASAKGTWLAFLDSDDEWLPGKLRAQLSAAREQGRLAVCSDALRVIPGRVAQERLLEHDASTLTFRQLLQGNLVICSAAMFHRSLLSRVGGFPEDKALTAVEDYALWLRVAALTDFAFVPRALVLYRDAPAESVRGSAAVDERRRRALVFDSFLRWAPALSPDALLLRAHQSKESLRHAKREAWRALGLSRP